MNVPYVLDEVADPPHQYLAAERVLGMMAASGRRRLEHLDPLRVLLLAVLGGGFITSPG